MAKEKHQGDGPPDVVTNPFLKGKEDDFPARAFIYSDQTLYA